MGGEKGEGAVPNVRARVTDESLAGWRGLCDEAGVSMSALIEATGLMLGKWVRESGGEMTAMMAEGVALAREIDADRRRRT